MPTLYIVNIPGPYLARKTPRTYSTQYAPEYYRDAEAKARELDLAPANVTMTLDGIAWLLSVNVILTAENQEEAERKAATMRPNFKRHTDPY
jgi:hypothetical protein